MNRHAIRCVGQSIIIIIESTWWMTYGSWKHRSAGGRPLLDAFTAFVVKGVAPLPCVDECFSQEIVGVVLLFNLQRYPNCASRSGGNHFNLSSFGEDIWYCCQLHCIKTLGAYRYQKSYDPICYIVQWRVFMASLFFLWNCMSFETPGWSLCVRRTNYMYCWWVAFCCPFVRW